MLTGNPRGMRSVLGHDSQRGAIRERNHSSQVITGTSGGCSISKKCTLSVEQVNQAAEYGPQPSSHNTTKVNKDQAKIFVCLSPTICRKRCDSVRT